MKTKPESPEIVSPFDIEKFNVNPFEAVQYYLETPELLAFSRASKAAKTLTQAEMSSKMPYELLLAVVQGQQDKAKKIIEHDPKLLLNNTAEVIDYSGKPIKNKTAFQAALINYDIEMAEMIQTEFLELENGQEELESQFYSIFPEGTKIHAEKLQKEAFDFNEIAQNIVNSTDKEVSRALAKNFNEKYPLNKVLNSFRSKFEKVSYNAEIFNPFHLLNAYQCYHDNLNNFTDESQRDLFFRQIFGYTLRHIPACFAQAFTQGLYYLVEREHCLKRSISLGDNQSENYFPLDGQEGWNIGFDSALLLSAGIRIRRLTRNCDGNAKESLHKFLQSKMSGIGMLLDSDEHRPVLGCFLDKSR